LTGQYTAFGKVTAGQDVADSISLAPCGQNDRPSEEIKMVKVAFQDAGGS